ncbi:hypothetical protein ABGB14_25365 [Nonomuraea sp. B10E15]|uniref:hypothetical protein n=1 Tax=Nonomuraea sp. B10E15 TaxID=3153560 RepID=UPI00325EEB61
MSLSDVIRNIAKTVTNKDELKEKAKDLPLLVAQTALSAAGQAMLLVDRVKNSVRGSGEKEEQDSRPAVDQLAAPAAEDEEKPARKEPVIFAPRPGAAEPNGTGKSRPDPVIFAPAGKTEPATAEPAEPAEPTGKAAETKPAEAKAAEAKLAEAKPAEAKLAEAKPAEAKAPEVKPAEARTAQAAAAPATPEAAEPAVEDKPAVTEEPAVAERAAAAKPAAKPKATQAKPKAARKPAARKSAAKEPAAAPEPVTAPVTDLAEPLPGYAELTVASLRARMRGKTAEQISAFLAYERATTARAEVIRMFENRLAKLQAGD